MRKGFIMNKMKNIVVVKNFSSNLVEEAIVVFKENVKIPEENFIKNNYSNGERKEFKNGLCVKEAENIIDDYINNVENKSKEEKLKKKLKFLKIINIVLISIILILAII